MKETPIDFKILDRECSIFCRYLIGQAPNDYVSKRYRDAHRSYPFTNSGSSGLSEDLLMKIARTSPWCARIIDIYSRFFQPFSVIRKKLVLLLAILESCAPTHFYLDSVDSDLISLLPLKLVLRCLTFAILLLVVILTILPLQLVVRGGANVIRLWLPSHG